MKKSIAFFVVASFLLVKVGQAGPVGKVAILPFQLNGPKNLEFLQEGILDMLSSRLSQLADLDLVDKLTLKKIVKLPDDFKVNADLLARLAKETGADFLIAGKLVMFGDTVNIDATLYRLPIIQPVSAVFVQGQGLNSLIPKINELAVGIIRELKTATSSALPALRAGWSGSATGPGKRLSRPEPREAAEPSAFCWLKPGMGGDN